VSETNERRLQRDETIKDTISFGIWDSHAAITHLQLQVAVSLALGVRASDDDVYVAIEDESFFFVRLDHGTPEEVDYLTSEAFLERLNANLAHFGGSAVLSKAPKLHKARETSHGRKTPVTPSPF
jgi:hypothetical protein